MLDVVLMVELFQRQHSFQPIFSTVARLNHEKGEQADFEQERGPILRP